MKKKIESIKKFSLSLFANEGGQGMAEYALLLVVIVAVAFIFRDQIKGAVQSKLQDVGKSISGFQGN